MNATDVIPINQEISTTNLSGYKGYFQDVQEMNDTEKAFTGLEAAVVSSRS
ncbi:MAG: hypothetical protein WC382_07295 [Methanoregulaceae archaeon]|jgi:hypothetical protein